MRAVSELYGRHADQDIYVVGSGTSLRVFPASFLKDKVTIGLNMAWKTVAVRYAVTIHPDLNIPELIGAEPRPDITWIVPLEKTRALLSADQYARIEPQAYGFEFHGRPNDQPSYEPSSAGRILEWVRQPTGDHLYVWSSIAQTGANLAANLGARNVILVGCDNGPLGANHHAHEQHTRWKGVDPGHRYGQYYEGMAEVRAALRTRGVNVVSLQPFLGISGYDQEFHRLCGELGRTESLESADISPNPGVKTRLRDLLKRVGGRLLP